MNGLTIQKKIEKDTLFYSQYILSKISTDDRLNIFFHEVSFRVII